MYTLRIILIAGLMATILAACSSESNTIAPTAKIATVDELLARACELAADCVSATPQDIADCPGDLLPMLSVSQIAELEAFVALDKIQQDSILACFDTSICGRFGGSLSNMSDADLVEPLRNCQ